MLAARLNLPARLRARVDERRELADIHAEMGRILGHAARDDANLVARPCPSCGARAPEDEKRVLGPVYAFHACSACGMVYAPKLLRRELVHDLYGRAPLARAYRAVLRRGAAPETYAGLVDRLAAAAPSTRAAVDVGSGFGALAAALGRRFDDVLGLELDPELAAEGRSLSGATITSQRLEELPRAPGSVDLVTMNQILEHVDDARLLVEAAHRLLAPRGVLWISVPQGGSLGVALLGGRHPVVATHMHTNLFDADSLGALVERAGFGVESLTSDDDPGLSLPGAAGLAVEKVLRLLAARTRIVSRRRRGACLELLARRA